MQSRSAARYTRKDYTVQDNYGTFHFQRSEQRFGNRSLTSETFGKFLLCTLAVIGAKTVAIHEWQGLENIPSGMDENGAPIAMWFLPGPIASLLSVIFVLKHFSTFLFPPFPCPSQHFVGVYLCNWCNDCW